MRFDSAGLVEEIVWDMRLADLPRGENRAVLDRLYNGDPPFDPNKTEENDIEINRNFLEGVNLLTQARRQWNNAFLKPGNYFTVTLDHGPKHKRAEYGHTITRNLNKELKRCRYMLEQIRGTGANVMIHGIGPATWVDRRCPVPEVLPISSLLIPSDTLTSFKNLTHFAVFKEFTPAELYGLTHGPKVDPGWNMEGVKQKLIEIATETRKQPNSTAYQYMPERIEDLIKQDGGYWGSDAVPTIDVWDFYFREREDGNGWYRRMILDWGEIKYDGGSKASKPDFRNAFLYDSKERKYANSLSEILHCQFGDCSATAPFKYHSVRSLGWMLWGVCDLQNRLRCRFSESVFEQLLWFFRTSNSAEFNRIKKAMFTHMGVIPEGINFVKAEERFKPDKELVGMQLAQNRMLMSENAAAYTQEPENRDKEMTATEIMARSNAVNALVTGTLGLAYEYDRFKGQEICRRFCIKSSPYANVRRFRVNCIDEGVPIELLNAEYWNIEPERVLGGGNKTLEIAQANQLQQLRKNLGAEAQREVDHIAIETYTDDPALAERLAPVQGQKKLSASAHDAQLATERILRGLPYETSDAMLPEDYARVWLADLTRIVEKVQQRDNMGTPDELMGMENLSAHIGQQVEIMGQNEDEADKVREFADNLKNLNNLIKGFAQRQAQAMRAAMVKGQAGENGKEAAMTAGKVQAMRITAQAKAANLRESHAQKTAQRQAQFELEQQREDRRLANQMRREGMVTGQELHHNRLKNLIDMESTINETAQNPD